MKKDQIKTNEKEEKEKKRKKRKLSARVRRTIAIIIAFLLVVAIGVALILAMRSKPVKTDTGKFYIVEEGNNSGKIKLSIKGEVPSKYQMRMEVPEDNSVYEIHKVSEEDDTVVYEIRPLETGAETLDFWYETPDHGDLYTKLHYTVEVAGNVKARLLTLNVTDPENNIDGPIK